MLKLKYYNNAFKNIIYSLVLRVNKKTEFIRPN